MSETNAVFPAGLPVLTVELLTKYVDAAEKAVATMQFLARWTPGTADDKAVAYVQHFIDFVKPHLKAEWLPVVLDLLNKLLQNKSVAAALDGLKLGV